MVKKIKILAPLSSSDETEGLIAAGADELFCGVLSENWQKSYSNLACANVRYWKKANLSGMDELKKVVDTAAKSKVNVILVSNNRYTPLQYKSLIREFSQAVKIGIKGVIVADIKLINALKKEFPGLLLYISTANESFNSESAKLFKELGADKITFPEQFSLGEIKKLVKANPEVEFEIFVLNDACKNIDGFCTFVCGGIEEFKEKNYSELVYRSAPCFFDYKINLFKKSSGKINESGINDAVRSGFMLHNAEKNCAACYLKDFLDMGLTNIKIAGRYHSKNSKIKDTLFISTLVKFIENNKCTSAEYRKFARSLFKTTYKFDCGRRLCYYKL